MLYAFFPYQSDEQVMREFSGQKNPGDDLYTTLDLELQKTASDALGDRKGAVVVMEPDTGRILADGFQTSV